MEENKTTKQVVNAEEQQAPKTLGKALSDTNNNTNSDTKSNTNQNVTKGKTVPQKRKPPVSGNGWTNDLKKAFEANERIQKERLNPHNKLNLKTEASIRITPLGGLGEIGGNMMVIETDNSAIIVDVGISFPDTSNICQFKEPFSLVLI